MVLAYVLTRVDERVSLQVYIGIAGAKAVEKARAVIGGVLKESRRRGSNLRL